MSKAPGNTETYVPLLQEHLPDQDIRVWPDALGDLADIEYAVIGVPHSGVLADLPNLKAVLSLWAGVDALLADPTFPHHIPLARMVDPLLAVDMTQFAIHWALHFHRGLHHYADLQQRKEWRQIAYPEASERRVGIMGLGVLGTDAAAKLAAMGFDVRDGTMGYFSTYAEHAYPIYDLDYTTKLRTLRPALDEMANLICCGRQGLFRYNNMDHSMHMGFLAARVVLGEDSRDVVWQVGTEGEIFERGIV